MPHYTDFKSNSGAPGSSPQGESSVSGTRPITLPSNQQSNEPTGQGFGSGPFGFGKAKIHAPEQSSARGPRFIATIEGLPSARGDFDRVADDINSASVVRHINLLSTLAAKRVQSHAVVTTEFEAGPSLLDLSERSRIPTAIILRILQDVARGLHALHSSTDAIGRPRLHGDVRPRNIIVGPDGTTRLFGYRLRSLLDANVGAELTNEVSSYAAPELLMDDSTDTRSDLFSLGVILWESIAGRQLFRAATPMDSLYNTVARPAPRLLDEAATRPELSRLCGKLLAKSRMERPDSALSLARDLYLVSADIDEVASHADVAEFVR